MSVQKKKNNKLNIDPGKVSCPILEVHLVS